MSENGDKRPDFGDDERVVSRGTLRFRHFVIIVAVVAAAAAAWYFWQRGAREAPPPEIPEGVTEVPEGSRTISLYFADKQAPALKAETRQVAVGNDFVQQLSQVVSALLEGPRGGTVSTMPAGTRLLNAFYDPQTGAAYLDFSAELVSAHPGGSSAEYYTVAAIVRTVSENFPEIKAVQLLVEGLQVGTLAGHVDIYGPLPVSEWR